MSGKEAQLKSKFPPPDQADTKKKQEGKASCFSEKHLDAQEQGTGNKEQGKDITPLTPHKGESQKKPSSRFKPPTVDEVRVYCQERRNHVDPERFVDHYTSNGWKIGKNPMKDWKASVRTWEKNQTNKPQNPTRKPGGFLDDEGITIDGECQSVGDNK